MPVKVRCPECQKVLTLPDQARGKTARCPDCQGRVPVPGAKKKPATARPKAAAAARKPARGKVSLHHLLYIASFEMGYYQQISSLSLLALLRGLRGEELTALHEILTRYRPRLRNA